ncbi:HWE histidine kinase domain-containing protein [Algimonas porphyrae]|uniref:histidine kinase n=1 Tax=Algimonas porphyrae TaxID=1128113 RepID=A0ABQ5UXU3_9PROT|nr:HWE histidine kinase domain-containing protein [Algimonas porphyrae]GLQ19978.1 hypothetical protein GCM10007854_09330 [Algimonas porphyrae]
MGIFEDIWQYMPHGMCLLWKPWLVLLWAGSDTLIFLSYFAIPLALLRVLRGRSEVPHRGLVLLFASFILLCGVTHVLSIVTLWYPIYPIVGFVKLATGIVSMTTAIVLFRLSPTLIALPSLNDFKTANDQLRAEVTAHENTLASLREVRDQLEIKVEERTAELMESKSRAEILAREAVHRSSNLLAIVSSLTQQSARGTERTEEFIDVLLGRLQALATANSTVLGSGDQTTGKLEDVIRQQLEPALLVFADRIHIEGTPVRVSSDAAQQINLAIHELATNAQKYNLPNSDSTQVRINWSVTDEEVLEFCWHEDLSGEAIKRLKNSTREGFGTKLLTRLVPATLKGTARQEITAQGLSYCLTIPLMSLLPEQAMA